MAAGLIFIVFIFIYFLPGFVAGWREHRQTLAIFVLNLLTGWTALGWIVALVWACMAIERRAYP
jgi:hypothetical protein